MQLTIAPGATAADQAKELLKRVQQEAIGTLSRNAIIDIITTIAVYKFTNLSREDVEAMLGIDFEETRIYKDLERETKLKVIRKLLSRGDRLEDIAEIVEMSVEEVSQIAQQQQS